MNASRAQHIARVILAEFDQHYAQFQRVTAAARERFCRADWASVQAASRERIDYYDQTVQATTRLLQREHGIADLDEPLWQAIKLAYVMRLHQHRQPELAETFYNSVFCGLFHRRYFNNRNIFVRPAVSTEHIDSDTPAYSCYYPMRDGMRRVVTRILDNFDFGLPYADKRLDVRNIMRFIRQWDAAQHGQSLHLAVLNFVFYRNKAAYLIGKLVNGEDETPFAIPVLNNEHGGVYVDTVLAGESALANVFSFARAYFMVNTDVPAAVVNFLSRILPGITRADLYTAIGLQKHGKTEFYRDFLDHLKYSSDEFVIAPGIQGMVMYVFTLPSYPYVFKVIKDNFPPNKDVTRAQVEAKYQLVKQHDRVGRMADSWEYSQAAFPVARFAPELLADLREQCASSLEFEEDQIVIRHLYIERRMAPLNMYISQADDEELWKVVKGYGNALRQLAGANIFPGDMLLKNFGVTCHGRVVFYDYDEICYLTECNFRQIPEAPYPEFEMSDEPWYSAGPHDVFPEEWATFLLSDPRVRKVFLELHGELLKPEYWQAKQNLIKAHVYEDVFPYASRQRFPTQRDAISRQTENLKTKAA
ncbi:MAG: bifunctional isocitrate dehydrogenase kinase/phosphatase [Gammaproteobacteria bacterium]|nr:bifunctional isocitrate dehydrogenase kinase/phosphatase [Gammaproteobacteria bacterium]